MENDACDTYNACIALALELQDLCATSQGGFAVEGVEMVRDRAAALLVHLAELANHDIIRAGQEAQRSMYRAMLSDSDAIAAVLEENSEPSDSASEGEVEAQAPIDNRAVRVIGQDGYYDDNRLDAEGTTDIDAYVSRLRLDESQPARECYSCMENYPPSQTIENAPCAHVWCRECLLRRVELAIKNENNYPLRCCRDLTNMPLDPPEMVFLVGAKLIDELKIKITEYETDDRTYCHDATCSTFITADTILNSTATCPSCHRQTCTKCKAQFHGDAECSTKQHDEVFSQWCEENEAATCPRCTRRIIISHGCNHMKCHCGTEFCYECNEHWKLCACLQWREDRLIEEAQVIAERQGGVGHDEAAAAVAVEDIAQQLRNEVECRHDNWTRTSLGVAGGGSNTCADCNWVADQWLWECDGCDKRVCHRCWPSGSD